MNPATLTSLASLCTLAPAHDVCPGHGQGLFHVRGVASLDTVARHFTEDGKPLLPAADLAQVYGIRKRTIYEWRRRGFLTECGLDESGQMLFDVAEVGRVKANPGKRKPSLPLMCAA